MDRPPTKCSATNSDFSRPVSKRAWKSDRNAAEICPQCIERGDDITLPHLGEDLQRGRVVTLPRPGSATGFSHLWPRIRHTITSRRTLNIDSAPTDNLRCAFPRSLPALLDVDGQVPGNLKLIHNEVPWVVVLDTGGKTRCWQMGRSSPYRFRLMLLEVFLARRDSARSLDLKVCRRRQISHDGGTDRSCRTGDCRSCPGISGPQSFSARSRLGGLDSLYVGFIPLCPALCEKYPLHGRLGDGPGDH